MTDSQPVTPIQSPVGARGLMIVIRVIASLTVLGILLRLTIRDSIAGLATIYYMTPLALIMLGAGVMFLRELHKRRKKHASSWILLFLGTTFCWMQVDWKYSIQPEKSERDIVIVLANLARDQDLKSLAERVRAYNPDILGFVEALAITDAQREMWQSEFPEYEWSLIGGGTQLLAKGKIGLPWVKALPDGTRLSRSVLTLHKTDQETEIHCYVVDIASTIYRSRAPALQQLTEFTNQSHSKNVLILGDFNTPSSSVHFQSLRKNFRNLFEEVGRGYAPTWPQPLPVLDLDQIWINENVLAVGCETSRNSTSDHRMLIGRVQVNESKNH